MPLTADEVQEQLDLLDTSSYYIFIAALALFLSFETVDIERQKLLCFFSQEGIIETDECRNIPSAVPFQFTSSVFTLAAVTYFFHLSEDAYQQGAGTTAELKTKFNYAASTLLLISSIIRLLSLFLPD